MIYLVGQIFREVIFPEGLTCNSYQIHCYSLTWNILTSTVSKLTEFKTSKTLPT